MSSSTLFIRRAYFIDNGELININGIGSSPTGSGLIFGTNPERYCFVVNFFEKKLHHTLYLSTLTIKITFKNDNNTDGCFHNTSLKIV